ncbi:hypothetical protein [Soonwooa sp.]|uniref:hypothetical protein n=1 Tax=Soonwooa sp. TaxID=1938592 RepID=UPI0026305C19|nr:hypothetical protein [Soonwooa sp.]
MKKIISALVVSGLILSCSSSNDDNPGNENIIPILPTKIVTDNGLTENFTYKNNNEISENNYLTGKKVYTYDGQTISKVSVYEGDKLTQTLEYKYANSRVSTITTTMADNSKIIYLLDWENDSHLKYTKVNVATSESTTGDYYYTNGNLSKTTNVVKDGDVTSTYENNYEFDGKQNPYYNVKGFYQINVLTPDFGKNNITKSTKKITYTSSAGTTSTTETTTSTYTFSSKNVPDQQTTKGLSANGQAISSVRNYFYNK